VAWLITRQDLVAAKYASGTIANKLTVLRRFYAAAQAAGFRQDNPVVGVRAPREKKAAETSATCPRSS